MRQRVQCRGKDLTTGIEHEASDGGERMEQKDGAGKTGIRKHDNT